MEQMTQFPALRYEKAEHSIEITPIVDTILSEYTFTLFLNGIFYQNFHCIPEALEELVLGHLYTHGMISSMEDIQSYSIDKAHGIAHFDIQKQTRKMIPLSYVPIRPNDILSLSAKLLTSSKVFEKTGNVHSVMLCQGEHILCFSEDVDRYRAFEKTVGKALKDNISFQNTCIYTTGRIPSPITTRAIFAGIPVIVSRSAPTDLTLKLAKEYHITIIGFARGNRMNLYHPLSPHLLHTDES